MQDGNKSLKQLYKVKMNVSHIKGITNYCTEDPVAGYEFLSSSNNENLTKVRG